MDTTRTKINISTKAFLILTIFLFSLVCVAAVYTLKLESECNTDLFTCNPYYFGDDKSYPKDCSNSFINATGNYCNGILVCENERPVK